MIKKSKTKDKATSEEKHRKIIYNTLHRTDPLRFPLEDYPIFYSWLNIPGDGKGLRLLDIACGQGFFLEAVEKGGSKLEVHGVDFSKIAIEKARERVRSAKVQLGSAYALPYPDKYFDYCVNLGSLEHFDLPENALQEIHRVLHPAGKTMVIVPNQYYLGTIWKVLAYGEGEDQGQEGITHFRTINSWTSLFLRNKLDVVGVRGYNGEDHIAWYFKRQEGKITEEEILWRTILNTFVKPWIPLNLSQCFVFFLRRQPLRQRG
jgi:ubiquinone/menaquinone biosynthesis C-methylase UbiE